ncbi:MAG TPA: succinylglutamate desuccinylase/aspartoacylase family protein [Patescibacteria group bacterium]|nr:succinylglutamate desuccinylase/aspartoacylase family protein [Patescibacteria group bacterium]
MNRYLIVGGTHGNEPLGINVCKKLERLSIPYLDVLYANKKAIRENKRFIQEDLNRVFPGSGMSYESRRAREIIKICKSYDFVIDFHNTYCPNNDCGFVGGDNWKNTVNLSEYLGLRRVIIADYDCINKYVKGCLSLEISLDSNKFNVDYWVKKIIGLKNFDPSKNYSEAELYKFSYRITREQQNIYEFPVWKAFQKLPKKDRAKLNLTGAYYPIFINDAYTSYNYAGLLQKLT